MFKLQMNAEVRKELDALKADIEKLKADVEKLFAGCGELAQTQRAIEAKLDQILKELEKPADSYVDSDAKKPEVAQVSSGRVVFTQRKQQRIANSRDPNFAERLVKSAAATKPAEEPKHED